MTDLDDVARLAMAMPGVVEGTSYGNRAWRAGKKLFVWERPLRKSDLESFGPTAPPNGPIVGVRVEDLAEKDAVLQLGHDGVFTVPHFDGHPTVLIDLDRAGPDVVEELVLDAWLCSASRRLVEEFRASDRPDP